MESNQNIYNKSGWYGFVEGDSDGSSIYIHKNSNFRGFIYFGEYLIVESGSRVKNALIGRMCHFGKNSQIGYSYIFKNLLFTYPAIYENLDLYFKSKSINKLKGKSFYESNPICLISDGVRVGDNAIVQSGVKIGTGAIILPNSVVVDDIPDFAIAGGVPAKVIEYRFDAVNRLKIKELKAESIDFVSIANNENVNYGDIESFVTPPPPYPRRVIQVQYFPDFSENKNSAPNTMLIGPSHVENWLKLIKIGKLNHPKFALWGISGLSITSPSIKNFVEFWISRNKENKLIIMVPDFRSGNSILINGNTNSRAIYKNALSIKNSDARLKDRLVDILDWIYVNYKSRVKFLFWSQYGRQFLNVKQGKYIDKSTGQYNHIISYDELNRLYRNLSIDLSHLKNFDQLIIDNSLHPSLEGYSRLEQLVLQSLLDL